MPQRTNSAAPPAMTWAGAALPLAVSAVFDALRFLCEWLWLLGPAMIALYCANKVGNIWVVGKLLQAGCVAAAAALGIGAATALIAGGAVMAMAVGFAGWLMVGLIMLLSNGRIFKENLLWFVSSLMVSEIPLVGSLPAITIAVWRMYSRQIKMEKAALQKWQQEQSAAQTQEQNQQIMQVMQIQAAQQAQFEQQEAANEEQYAEEQAEQEMDEDSSVEAQFEEQKAANDDTYGSVSKAA